MQRTHRKLEVHLSPEARRELEAVCRAQSVSAAKVRRARILLLSDEDHVEGRRPDWQIAEMVGVSEKQAARVRQKFVREGLPATIERKRRATPGTPPKFDGEVLTISGMLSALRIDQFHFVIGLNMVITSMF